MNKNAAVIVAAGRGERLGATGGPKQYRMLAGKSVLQRTLDCFTKHPAIDIVQVVIHPDDRALYDAAVHQHEKLADPVGGGVTRQQSSRAGIEAVAAKSCVNVLIHDAARPFVSAQTIDNVLSGIASGTCALPACAVSDTLKRAKDNGEFVETVSRDGLHFGQTPQGFVMTDALTAHKKAAENNLHDFTDDAAVGEWAGLSVVLVEGDRNNFKITTQEDMAMAQQKADKARIPDVRTGNGYDVHQLIPGKTVTLCGIEIPHTKSLSGHSDADVGLHALTDALLGTIGEGDIGSHFPPSDEKWKNAASDQFLIHATELVRGAGGSITNLDITLICEAPKIGPHRQEMRMRVAEIAGIDVNRVSVKATTNERIGFVGREEGIAAIATATVVFSSDSPEKL